MPLPPSDAPAAPAPATLRPVEAIEPEGLDVSARLLTEPGPVTNRMRKNMMALRTRIIPSHAPILREENEEGQLVGYVWDTAAKISDDVKLERRLHGRTMAQLMKLRHRCAVRSVRLMEKAAVAKRPAVAQFLRNRADVLRNVLSSATYEAQERLGERSAYLNPDGN